MRAEQPALVAVLIASGPLLAACTGTELSGTEGGSSEPTSSEYTSAEPGSSVRGRTGMRSATAIPSSGRAVTNGTAMRRALAAEERRVEAVLADVSNLSGDTAIIRRHEATVRNRSAERVRLVVTTSYSYEYHCDGSAGTADGLVARSVYRVTQDAVELVRVVEPVTTICDR